MDDEEKGRRRERGGRTGKANKDLDLSQEKNCKVNQKHMMKKLLP